MAPIDPTMVTSKPHRAASAVLRHGGDDQT